MQSSSSPVAAAAAVAAVASTSTFKNWRKNNPEKYKQYKQRKAASMRAKRKSNPERYKEENKRQYQQKRNKKIAERIRAAEAKRAEAAAKNEAATTNHVMATTTPMNHQQWLQLQPQQQNPREQLFYDCGRRRFCTVAGIVAVVVKRQNNEHFLRAEIKFMNECFAWDVPYVAPKMTDTAKDHVKRRGRARRLIMCRSKVLRPVPPPPFPSVVARSESADIIPKCNCNYNFDRSAQLEEQANPIELHGEEEENTTDAFRQSPPPLDDMTEGSGDSDEAVNENEYEAVTGEDDPTTTGPGVLSTVKALLTAYDEETVYGTDYDEETVYDER